MRWPCLVALGVAACGPSEAPRAKPAAPPPKGVSTTASTTTKEPPRNCLVVHEEAPENVEVEGTLVASQGGGFVLRLARPRCVLGLRGASFVAEVHVASTGLDLRPLVGARIRASGDGIAGQSDLGGAAVVVIASHIERVAEPQDGP
jgi:hypothetical protein